MSANEAFEMDRIELDCMRLLAFLYQSSCTPVPDAVQLNENMSPVKPRMIPLGTVDRIVIGSVETHKIHV